MPEQEELRLTVTLADNASAGLEKLNEQIKQLGSGASQQHVEKFKRETNELTRIVKDMTGGVGEAFKALGMLRGGFAAGASGIALFGIEVVRQIKDLQAYSDKIRQLNQEARQIGVNPGQLKSVLDQLEAFGISGDAAASSIASVAAKIADLNREGSQVRQNLLKQAGPDAQAVQNMRDYLDRLRDAKTLAEQLNVMREGGEQVYRNALRETGSTQEAANRRNEFWSKQGYNALLAAGGNLRELSAEEQRLADERAKRADAYSNQLGQIESKWKDIVGIFKDEQLASGPLLWGLQAADKLLDIILNKLKEARKDANKPVFEDESVLGHYTRRFLGIAPPAAAAPPKDPQKQSEDNTDQLKKLSGVLQETNSILLQPASLRGGGMGGGGMGGGLVQLASLGMPATARAPSRFGGGYGGGDGTAGASPYSVAKGGDPRGLEQYIRETATKYGVDPDTAVKVAASEGLANPQGDIKGGRARSFGAFQLFTGGGLGNEFQMETGLDPSDPRNEKATIDYALKNVARTGWGPYHGAARVGIGPRAGIGINGQTAGPGTGAGAGGAMAGGSVPKPVLDEAKALLIRGGGSGELQQFMASKGYPRSGAWCGQFTASVVTEAGGKPPRNAAVASNWLTWGEHVDPADVREGDIAVRTRSRYGGRTMPGQTGSHVGIVGGVGEKTIDMVGGNQVRPVQPRNRWSGEWEYRRAQADRRQLDATQATETKVNGSGKITVDVNAPKGTHVGAEGGGLFKDVEINRQTQMLPASRGPADYEMPL
jgi:hypothetical protein